jgi:hypothetical protein
VREVVLCFSLVRGARSRGRSRRRRAVLDVGPRRSARLRPGTRGRISFNLSAVITAVRSRPRGPARCAVRATRLRDARLTVSVGPRYVIFLFRVETAVRHRRSRGREPENHREPGPGTRAQAPRRPRDRTRRDRNDWLHRSSYTPPELDKPRTYSQFPYQPYRDAPPARLAAITRGLRARRARSPK